MFAVFIFIGRAAPDAQERIPTAGRIKKRLARRTIFPA